MGIAKIYNPLIIENKWLVKWEKEDFFKSEPNEKTPYTILIPPPNVTGILHMGHMLNNTIQDILIRKARLSGYNACWVPGTDHASIATEAKVVNKLKEIGLKKHELARDEFGGNPLDGGTWHIFKNPKNGKDIIVKDVICDAFLQQILHRPAEYDVLASPNLNGDYISDALAAQVGGIGIAPGANLGDTTAVFEATHGTAPKYAGQNKVNPGSLILSAEMMLRHMGWIEAADLIIKSMDRTISAKKVTYDFARMMTDADMVSSSGFGDEMIKRM